MAIRGTDKAFVFAGNDGVAVALAVAMRSSLSNLSWPHGIGIYVLDDGLSPRSRERLAAVVNRTRPELDLRWLPVPAERLRHLGFDPRWTSATNARLLIPELIPTEIDRVVYLDADILVRGDLSPLLSMDLNGAPLGAVMDFLERGRPYFNAGVLVMDLDQWRTDRLADRVLQHGAEHGSESQDALNAVLDDWCELDYKWNVQHGNLFFAGLHGLAARPLVTDFTDRLYRQRWRLYREAVVLHFVGGVKPWDPLCPLPGTTAWAQTMIGTGWYSRRQALRWASNYSLRRTRYWMGTARRLVFSRALRRRGR